MQISSSAGVATIASSPIGNGLKNAKSAAIAVAADQRKTRQTFSLIPALTMPIPTPESPIGPKGWYSNAEG